MSGVWKPGQGVFITEFERYKYYECEGCGMVYLANLPETNEMYTGEETANGSAREYEDQFVQRVDMITKPKVEFVLDLCRQQNIRIDSWLDIGCGIGEILHYLEKNTNVKGAGIETDPKRVDFIRRQLGEKVKIFDKYLEPDNCDREIMDQIRKTNVITMINVLEHVQHPKRWIEFLHQNMEKGSVLVIEVPRHPSAASFANLMMPDRIYRHISAPVHLSIFSEASMDCLLEGKFRMIGKWGFGQGFADIVNNAVMLSDMYHKRLYQQLLDCSNKVQKVLDESGLSDSMIFAAVNL